MSLIYPGGTSRVVLMQCDVLGRFTGRVVYADGLLVDTEAGSGGDGRLMFTREPEPLLSGRYAVDEEAVASTLAITDADQIPRIRAWRSSYVKALVLGGPDGGGMHRVWHEPVPPLLVPFDSGFGDLQGEAVRLMSDRYNASVALSPSLLATHRFDLVDDGQGGQRPFDYRVAGPSGYVSAMEDYVMPSGAEGVEFFVNTYYPWTVYADVAVPVPGMPVELRWPLVDVPDRVDVSLGISALTFEQQDERYGADFGDFTCFPVLQVCEDEEGNGVVRAALQLPDDVFWVRVSLRLTMLQVPGAYVRFGRPELRVIGTGEDGRTTARVRSGLALDERGAAPLRTRKLFVSSPSSIVATPSGWTLTVPREALSDSEDGRCAALLDSYASGASSANSPDPIAVS